MAKKPTEGGKRKARVLLDCSYGRADTVVELTDAEMESAKAGGEVDDHPDAVRHAETLAAGQS